jgi:hypothetical protein
MQFQLPSNLQTELLAYDPKLKVLWLKKEPKKASKKSKYPLGNIPHIVPADVVRPLISKVQSTSSTQLQHHRESTHLPGLWT